MNSSMTLSARLGRMEENLSPRLKRRNALRRPRRFDIAVNVSRSEQSIPEAVLEEESDSGPSSTKSSPIPSPPSPGISSQEGDGDDTIFLENGQEPAYGCAAGVVRRYSSYDRAVGFSTRDRRHSSHYGRSKSVEEPTGRHSPGVRSKTRSPFRLPWKSRSRGKGKDENASEAFPEANVSAPIFCLPAYKRSRSKHRPAERPASASEYVAERLHEDFVPNGVAIPKRIQKKERGDSLPRRMAMCFPAFLSGNGDDRSSPVSESYSPPKVNRVHSLTIRSHTSVGFSDSYTSSTGAYPLHGSNSEPNLVELSGEASVLEDTIRPDLEVVTQMNSILKLNVDHVVEEITLLDCEAWRSIAPSELEDCAWMKKDKNKLAPSVMEMIDWFNRLALTVATQVLSEESVSLRARVLSRFIQIAHKLWNARNFNSLKAVLAGLQCTPVFRLRKTWKEISSKKRRIFRELAEIMSEDDNYSVYRHELAHALKGPRCIAFLGVFLTDVCQTMSYQQVRHQRQMSDGGEKISKAQQTLKQHRRCVSSEVGANHRIHTDTNPLHSFSHSLPHGDGEFFPNSPHPVNAIHQTDSGVGSSDSVGSEHERREFHSVLRVGTNRHSSPKLKEENVPMPRVHSGEFCRSPSTPIMSTHAVHTPTTSSAIHITTDWHYNNPLSDYELFQYGALLDVRAIWRQTDWLALSRSTSPVRTPSPVSQDPELCGKDPGFRHVSDSSSEDDDETAINKQGGDEEYGHGVEGPPVLLTIPRSAPQSKPSATSTLERKASIRMSKRLQRHETTPAISSSLLMKKELPKNIHDQLWSYQEKAMHFSVRSRPSMRSFLTSVKYNTEEANYRLSLIREPRDVSKSTT